MIRLNRFSIGERTQVQRAALNSEDFNLFPTTVRQIGGALALAATLLSSCAFTSLVIATNTANAGTSSNELTLGHLGEGSAKGDNNVRRNFLEPTLHFDGLNWREVADRLKLQEDDPRPSCEASRPLQCHPLADTRRDLMEQRAKVPSGSWVTWWNLFSENNIATVAGAWQTHSRCEPGYVLGLAHPDRGSIRWRDYKERGEFYSTKPIPAAKFVETTLTVDDSLRRLALREWRSLEARLITKTGRDGILEKNLPKMPKTLEALRRYRLDWLPAQCAVNVGERVCQLDARRRFDGKVTREHDLEPIGYSILISQVDEQAPRVLDLTVRWLPIWESFSGVPSEPDFPIAFFETGGKRWIYRIEPVMEGASYCVHGIDRERRMNRSQGVCATWAC